MTANRHQKHIFAFGDFYFYFRSNGNTDCSVCSVVAVELILDLFPSVFTLLLRTLEASFSWEDYRLPGNVKQFHISWMLS